MRQNYSVKRMRKRLFQCVLVIFLILFITMKTTSKSVSQSPDHLYSPYVYFIERDSGEVLYRKNSDKKIAPASLTKMMTILVALDHIEDLSDNVMIDERTYKQLVLENASMAGFFPGEQVTYRDLLYGTMLSSGGEAANTLALSLAGKEEQFVAWMNEKAQSFGMRRTHFANVEGLDDPLQYSTAADIAVLTDQALENGHFEVLFTKPTYHTSATLEHPEGIVLKSTVLTNLRENKMDGFQIMGGEIRNDISGRRMLGDIGKNRRKRIYLRSNGKSI